MNDQSPSTSFKIKHIPSILSKTFTIWTKNDPFRLSAVIAYYAVLSLPGLLVILINSIGAIWGEDIVQNKISTEISSALGPDTSEAIISIIKNSKSDDRSLIATLLGIGILIFGATGVFYHLQISMNQIWNVSASTSQSFWEIIKARAVSFGFVMVIAFMFIVSFVASTILTALNEYISLIWEPAYVVVSRIIGFSISVVVLGFLFILIFKYMPDVEVKWQSVWIGGIITSILFNIGKELLSEYFGQFEPGSVYGAAGSVVLVLLWVSYSSMILFYGAAFTKVYAERYGLYNPDKKQLN